MGFRRRIIDDQYASHAQPLSSSIPDIKCTNAKTSATITRSGREPEVSLDCAQQLLARERLGQVLLGTNDPTTGAIEQAILTGQHDNRRVAKQPIMFY